MLNALPIGWTKMTLNHKGVAPGVFLEDAREQVCWAATLHPPPVNDHASFSTCAAYLILHASEYGVRLTFRLAEISPPKVLDANGYHTPGIRLINHLFTKPDITFRFYFKAKKIISSSLRVAQQNSEHSNIIKFRLKSNKSGPDQFCDIKNAGLGSKRLHIAETISDDDSSYRPESSEGSRSKHRRLPASASPVVETPEPESRVCPLQVICQAMHPLTRMAYLARQSYSIQQRSRGYPVP